MVDFSKQKFGRGNRLKQKKGFASFNRTKKWFELDKRFWILTKPPLELLQLQQC